MHGLILNVFHEHCLGHGYLRVWADNEGNQNSADRRDLHVGFKLSGNGDFIALFTPEQVTVDLVRFGPQTTDISEGRFPDGAQQILRLTNMMQKLSLMVLSMIAPIMNIVQKWRVNDILQISTQWQKWQVMIWLMLQWNAQQNRINMLAWPNGKATVL